MGSVRNNVNADGSTSADGGKDGVLYRLDPSGEVIIFRGGIGISNTLAWSPDRSRFYFGDSLANVIWAYDYDLETGAISHDTSFLRDFPRSLSDGSTVDAQGYPWNCIFGGGG